MLSYTPYRLLQPTRQQLFALPIKPNELQVAQPMSATKPKYEVGDLAYFKWDESIFRTRISYMRWSGDRWSYIGEGIPDWVGESDVSDSLARVGGRSR